MYANSSPFLQLLTLFCLHKGNGALSFRMYLDTRFRQLVRWFLLKSPRLVLAPSPIGELNIPAQYKATVHSLKTVNRHLFSFLLDDIFLFGLQHFYRGYRKIEWERFPLH